MRKAAITVLILSIGLASVLPAQTYRVAVGDIPGAVENNVALLKAIASAMNFKLEVQIVPMNRMFYMVTNGQADLGVPTIKVTNPEKVKALPYDLSEASIVPIELWLYTNKAKPVSIEELKNGNKKNYYIESEAANIDLIDFKIYASTTVEAGIKKLDAGRIDGFIHNNQAVDPIIEALKLKSIDKQLFVTFDTGYVLPKGQRGGKLDKLLVAGKEKLRKSGELKKLGLE